MYLYMYHVPVFGALAASARKFHSTILGDRILKSAIVFTSHPRVLNSTCTGPHTLGLTPSHLHTGHLALTCTAHPPPHIHWPYALSPVSASCEDYRCRDSLLQLHGSLSQHTSRECVQRCYVACKCVCVDRKSAHDGRLTAVIQWGETIKQPLSLAAPHLPIPRPLHQFTLTHKQHISHDCMYRTYIVSA